MKSNNYSSCELLEHESEFLNMVCIDHQCKNRRLLCSYCQEDHQKCKKIALKAFIKIYQDQINPKHLDNIYNKDLILQLNSIETILCDSQKQFNNIFNQINQAINNLKQSVNKMTHCNSQYQSQILQKFELEPSYCNFVTLLQEIESFIPNTDKISFTIKKSNHSNLQSISHENMNNMKSDVQQFQNAVENFTEKYRQLNNTLEKRIQNLLQKNLIELENNQNNLDNLLPLINQEHQVQESMQIEHNQNVSINSQYKQQQENVQLTEQQMIDRRIEKQDHNNFRDLQQSDINEVAPISELSPYQNNEQQQNEKVLMINIEKEFQFMLEGSEITKILQINQYHICVICGLKFYIFDISNQTDQNVKSIYTLSNEVEYTDLAYLKLNEQQGNIYLATKKGIIYKLIIAGVKNIKITASFGQNYKIEKPGILQILINADDKQLFSLGEGMIVRIWNMDTMQEFNRKELKEQATVLHIDWKLVFIGGNYSLNIWNYITEQFTQKDRYQSRVNKILTNESNLFLGLEDKIKIYKRTNLEGLDFFKDIIFEKINLIQIIKTEAILIVSYIEEQVKRVGLYDFSDTLPPQQLFEQAALICSVYQQDMVYFLAFAQKMGHCITCNVEQKSLDYAIII